MLVREMGMHMPSLWWAIDTYSTYLIKEVVFFPILETS